MLFLNLISSWFEDLCFLCKGTSEKKLCKYKPESKSTMDLDVTEKKMWFEIIQQIEWPIWNDKEDCWTGANILNWIEPYFIIGFDFGFLILKDTQT